MNPPNLELGSMIILQGELSQEFDMAELLKLVAQRQDVVHGVLQISHGETVGLIAVAAGKEISGALTSPARLRGAEALQVLFSMKSGQYCFLSRSSVNGDLDQSLKLSLDTLFARVRRPPADVSFSSQSTAPPTTTGEDVSSGKTSAQLQVSRRLRAVEERTPSTAGADSSFLQPWMKLPAVVFVILAGLLIFQISLTYVGKLRMKAGLAALSEGDADSAVDELSLCIKCDSRRAPAYLYRALAYARLGQMDSAIKDYDYVLSVEPDNISAILGRACQLYKRNQYDKAIEDCNLALKFDPKSTDALQIRALAEIKDHQNAKAESDCKQYLRLIGKSVSALELADLYAVLAQLQLKAGEFGDAISHYGQAIAFDNESSSLYLGRAEAFKTAGDWRRAAADCTSAIKLGAGADAYALRALCQQALGDTGQALQDIKQAMILSPQNLHLYRQRGDLEMVSKDYEHAAADFQFILRMAPKDFDARQKYDVAYMSLSKDAKKLLAAAAEKKMAGTEGEEATVPTAPTYSGDVATLIRTGYALQLKGQTSEALLAFVAAVKADPNSAEARRYLAHALMDKGSNAEAVEQFGVLSGLGTMTFEDQLAYATALDRSGQPQRAVVQYEGCLAAHPDNRKSRLALINLYAHLGSVAKAKRVANEGLMHAKDSEERQLFQSRLKSLDANGTQTPPSDQES